MWTFCILVTLGVAVSSHYVPGTPGAPWSEDDLAETKEKILWIIDNPESALKKARHGNKFKQLYERDYGDLDAILPTAAKIVRLSFHDCLVEPDTGAGCNGCLNFHGLQNAYYLDICKNPITPEEKEECIQNEGGLRPQVQNETDNNNLFWVAQVLEKLYKRRKFGGVRSERSLYEAGKSRADLWAFAGLVAVRKTIENNNVFCQNYVPNSDCLLEKGNSTFCEFDLSRNDTSPVFKTGRSDCVSECGCGHPDFCTTETELHPNPHGTGVETGEFLVDNFGVDVQQAVGLLGAHAIGRTHKVNSMFRSKPWTPQGVEDWNNLYYINGVNYITVADPTNSKNCRFVDPEMYHDTANGFTGDEYGNALSVKYRVRSEQMTANGGPWNWNLFSKGCNRDICATITNFDPRSCCKLLNYCDDHPVDCPFGNIGCSGSDCDEHNVFLDVNMLNADMGIVFDFTRNSDGRPQGCPGLDDQDWNNNLKPLSGEVECGTNNEPSNMPPPEDLPNFVRTYFLEYEFYANNPRNWLVTFRKAFDIMLENGYDSDNLVEASTCWLDDSCC